MATPAPQTPPQTPDTTGNGANTPTGASPNNATSGRFNRESVVAQNPLEGGGTFNDLRYPLVLGTEEYPHYVVFYPLVREKSKYGKRALANGGQIFDQSGQNRQDPANANQSAMVAGAAAGAALGVGAMMKLSGGKSVGNSATPTASEPVLNRVGGLLGSVFLGAAGGAAGGVLGAGIAAGLQASFGKQRLVFGDSSIALHISERVSSSYKAQWDIEDMGALIGAVGSGKTDIQELLSNPGELAQYGVRKLAKVGQLAGSGLSTVFDVNTKTVENPYKEQLFRSMGFRTFVFDYVFAPRNSEEAEMIFGKDKILDTFLRNMHPTQHGDLGLYLSYPSEFLIIYYYKDQENTRIRKISNCALTDMAIDYGAEGFTTFEDGTPSQCAIRLTFTELETMTADRIELGY